MVQSEMLPNVFTQKKEPRWGAEAAPTSDELDIRTCAQYIAKLQNVLEDATGEAPRNINIGEIEHRILLLQGAIEEVKNKKTDLVKEKELMQQERYLSAVHRLLQEEELLNSRQAKDTEDKIQAVKQAREEAIFYFKDKNEKNEERMKSCLSYRQQADANISVKAASNEVRRTQNLEKLYAERARKQAEARERELKRQQYARDVIRNRDAMQKEKNRKLEEINKLREQEIAEKLEAIRESRKSKWVDKRKAGIAQAQAVWKNGDALEAMQAKNHEQLVADLEEKGKGQKERYAAEIAEQEFYIKQQQRLRKEREIKVTNNLIHQANQRLRKGDTIVEKQKKKWDQGEQATQRKEESQVKAGAELRKVIAEHQRRARALEEERQHKTLTNTFVRWNHRAARIISNLRDIMEEDKKEKSVTEDPWQNNTQAVVQPPQEKRPIRLPYPSDFQT